MVTLFMPLTTRLLHSGLFGVSQRLRKLRYCLPQQRHGAIFFSYLEASSFTKLFMFNFLLEADFY